MLHAPVNDTVSKKTLRDSSSPPLRPPHVGMRLASPGNQALLRAAKPILQRQEITQDQPGGGPTQGAAPQRTGNCSGWEADVESFTKKIAEFYVQDALGTAGHATTIECQ